MAAWTGPAFANPNNALFVAPAPASAISSPTVVTATGTPTALPDAAAEQGVIVQADPSNGGAIEIGGTGLAAGSGIALSAGDPPLFVPVDNASRILVVGNTYKLRYLVL